LGTTPALMVVLTHPQDPAREAEFNEWYSGNHLQDVLLVPNFESASRFKQSKVNVGSAPPYLALYQVNATDMDATHDAVMQHFGAPNAYRLPMPPASGGAEGGLVGVDGWGYYEKIGEQGTPSPSGDKRPRALMVVFTHPADPSMEDAFNEWYNGNHIIDVIKAPHFRSATRYRLKKGVRGDLPGPYLAIYELDDDHIEAVHEKLMTWLQTPDDFRLPMPTIPGGAGLVGIDFWGYYSALGSALPIPLATLLSQAG